MSRSRLTLIGLRWHTARTVEPCESLIEQTQLRMAARKLFIKFRVLFERNRNYGGSTDERRSLVRMSLKRKYQNSSQYNFSTALCALSFARATQRVGKNGLNWLRKSAFHIVTVIAAASSHLLTLFHASKLNRKENRLSASTIKTFYTVRMFDRTNERADLSRWSSQKNSIDLPRQGRISVVVAMVNADWLTKSFC